MSKPSEPTEPSNVHPIAGLLLRSLRPKVGAGYTVPDECADEIGATLEKLVQTTEFMPAITTLIRFCKVLESRGAGEAARAIVRAAKAAVPELERLTGANSAANAAEARARFARLTGETRAPGGIMRRVEPRSTMGNVLALRASAGGGRR